ncbi:ABC transporter transmembrane domain-containing protein, partial [Staphylococcus felis]
MKSKENNHLQLSAKQQMHTLWRLIRYTFPFKKLIILALVLLAISTVANMAVPYIVKVFIDQYLTVSHFPKRDISLLLAAFIGIEIIGAVTTYFSIYYLEYLAFKVIQQLRIEAFHKISRLGMRFYDQTPSGSIVSRLTNDTEAIVEMFTGVLSSFLIAIFMIIASFVMMFLLDIKLAFFALLFIPIII